VPQLAAAGDDDLLSTEIILDSSMPHRIQDMPRIEASKTSLEGRRDSKMVLRISVGTERHGPIPLSFSGTINGGVR
jgi:hypothetical protein